ncbi:SEL1-like repeat protein, partial [Conservatibacter flavescens]
DLHNMWLGKKGDDVWKSTERYYRIAAANGDYKANVRLQYLIESGRIIVKKPQKTVYELNKALEKQLPATAYYNLYGYLTNGYGVKTEKGGQFAYLRKAADLGSREAQYELAEVLGQIQDKASLEFRKSLRKKLLDCSSKQGMGLASRFLGIRLKNESNFELALRTYHQGVKNGDDASARRLSEAFSNNKTETYNLSLKVDPERAIRYQMIEEYLYDNSYLNPTVPDLDEIVPLPPAKLPAWDGKIAFQRWYEGASPPKPSEELMQKLADQAGLDVNTGLPKK